ncbi:hypothetical protein [Thalassospira australica]|uniref:hypothetical protein n=1 Tax=Thalassospira australica TaxID=1528106 RepID=UPI003850C748
MEPIKHTLTRPAPYALGIWGGLWLPDIDLALLSILHHRSIITHSILIPWLLFVILKNRVPFCGIAGLYAGIAIHLAADCLSATVGFGMIWTPWPFKASLGPASPIWIVVNAALGIWLSLKLTPEKKIWLVTGMCLVALGYSVLNEMAMLPFITFGLIFSVVFFIRYKMMRKQAIDKTSAS